MRQTSFGQMASLMLPGTLAAACEVMAFKTKGEPHAHKRVEVAICAAGHGTVWIEEPGAAAFVEHYVSPGQYVEIPATFRHYMEPAEGATLSMVITYLEALT